MAVTDKLDAPARRHGVTAHGALGPALAAATVLAAGFYFREGGIALLEAWSLPEYSHGPLIPVLSAFLFLRDLKGHAPAASAPRDVAPGLLVIAAALLLGALGKFAQIYDIVAYAMILFIGGFILTVFGWRRGRAFWPAVLHLVFMLPLPGILYWKVSTTLQFVSSELGVWLIQLVNIPVFLDGNIIDLGVYKLHVAEACSGLRYLYPIMSFSYIFAALYRGPVWHKAVLLLAAAPITVVMNSVRIGLIGIIVDAYGLDHVEGVAHLLEGWVIFLVSVLLLFGLAALMLSLQRARMSLAEALDIDFTGIGPQMARMRDARPTVAMGVAAALALASAAAWEMAPRRDAAGIERAQFAAFPATLGAWRRVDLQTLEPEIEQALAADDYYSGSYRAEGSPAPVDLFFAWYQDQTRGGIHSPEVCLPSGGWEVADIERVEIAFAPGKAAYPVNRAVIQKGEARLLVYYWFEQYGGRTASDYVAKASLLRDALVHGRSDGALARIITPILVGESVETAEARLRTVADAAADVLPRFVPRL